MGTLTYKLNRNFPTRYRTVVGKLDHTSIPAVVATTADQALHLIQLSFHL